MKKMMAVLLAILIIGTAPAIAIPHGETADAMAVKGKGAAESAVQILENENNTSTGQNMTTETSNTAIGPIGNNDPAPADDQATGADVQVPVTSANDPVTDAEVQLSNDSLENNGVFVLENDTTENLTIPQIDTSGIVMQSSDFSCGPAALATVLNNLGVHATEQELIVLAGTDTSGTTMHGLSEAAKVKGVNAVGMRLSVDDLRPNNIVHIILDGEGHYSVVREVSENSVYLADPSLGNIEMSREEFSAIFTGNVLVISDPNNSTQVNQTETTNQTGIVQAENQTLVSEEMESIKGQLTVTNPENSQILTSEMMESIRGRWWEEVSKWGRWAADWVVDNARKLMPGPKGEFTYNASGNSTSNATGNYSSYQVGIKLTVSAKQTTKKRKIIRRR